MKLIALAPDSRSADKIVDRIKTLFPAWARVFDNVYAVKENQVYVKPTAVRDRVLTDLEDESLFVVDINKVDDDPIWASKNISKDVNNWMKK